MELGLTQQELKDLSSFGKNIQDFATNVYGPKDGGTLIDAFDCLFR